MHFFSRLLELFTFRTLLGRIRIMITSFVIIILIIAGLVFYQNYKASTVTKVVTNTYQPASRNAYEIINGLNRASTLHRGYIITQNTAYQKELKKVWLQIDSSMANLMSMKRFLADRDQRMLDTIQGLAYQYRNLQNEITDYYDSKAQWVNINPDDPNYAQLYSNLFAKLVTNYQVRQRIKEFLNSDVNSIHSQLFARLEPFALRMADELEKDAEGLNDTINFNGFTILLLSLLGIGIGSYLGFTLYASVNQSVKKPTDLLNQLAAGGLPEETEPNGDELDEIIHSSNDLAKHIKAASEFALSIGEGDYEKAFQSRGQNDVLGNALLQMRDKLSEVAKEEKERSWLNSKLAEFGDTIRSFQNDPNALADEILGELIPAIEAVQGGLFILTQAEDGSEYLEMMGCYAYNRKKYLEKRVQIGDGLLGQVFLEKETTRLKRVPEQYMMIDSALGEKEPEHLMLVPLVVNEKCEGVVELAGITPFKDVQVELVEKLGQSIAGSINNVRTNERQKELLEQSQKQAEQMQSQEEELRQNMEEMSATQEEMERLQRDMEMTLEALDESSFALEINGEQKIIKANKPFNVELDYDLEELVDKDLRYILPQDLDEKRFEENWQKLLEGERLHLEERWIGNDGTTLFVKSNYVPHLNEDGRLIKVVALANNITEERKIKKENEQNIEELRVSQQVMRNSLEKAQEKEQKYAKKVDELADQKDQLERDLQKVKEGKDKREKELYAQFAKKDQRIAELEARLKDQDE